MGAFKKEYKSADEELKRMKIFFENAHKTEQLQLTDDSAEYSMVTKFADLTEEEFKKYNGVDMSLHNEKEFKEKEAPKLPTEGLPKNFDWREDKRGVVNAVKNQAQCGSCWAFGTVANIEGSGVVQGGRKLLNLAEQELVDCSKSDMGCNGGLPSRAYTDMIKNKMGLEAESAYPYTAKTGQCHVDASKEIGFIDDWTSISQDEDQIKAAVYKYGPLAIALNATPLQTYSGGILDPWFCNPMGIDHAVTLIGWGTEDSGSKSWPWDKTKDYWIVRNSWGADWGEQGYFKIARGKGKCGMNRVVTSAIIKPKEAEIVV